MTGEEASDSSSCGGDTDGNESIYDTKCVDMDAATCDAFEYFDDLDEDEEDREDLGNFLNTNSRSKWTEPKDSTPTITIDRARIGVWERAKNEITRVRGMISKLPGGAAIDKTTRLFFGDKSPIFHSFQKLGLDEGEFRKFIATLFVVCEMNQSLKRLHENARFDTDDLMTPTQFNEVLRKMDGFGKSTNKRFWQLLEENFNEIMRENFVPGINEEALKECENDDHAIVIDDDKVDFNHGKAKDIRTKDLDGLKRVRHVMTNTKGLNNHCAVLSASGILVGSTFERDVDKGTDVIERLMKYMYNERTNFFGQLLVLFDRGYSLKALFCYLHEHSIHFLSTIRRLPFLPITFTTEKKPKTKKQPANQVVMSSSGGRLTIQRTLAHRGSKMKSAKNPYKVTLNAYRSGFGSSVAMTMNSLHHRPSVDLIMANTADVREWGYGDHDEAESFMRGFRFFAGEPIYEEQDGYNIDVIGGLLHKAVLPVTETQLGCDWWLGRSMVLTSSTMGSLIQLYMPHILPNDELYPHFNNVATYLGLQKKMHTDYSDLYDGELSDEELNGSVSDGSCRDGMRDEEQEEVMSMRGGRSSDDDGSSDEVDEWDYIDSDEVNEVLNYLRAYLPESKFESSVMKTMDGLRGRHDFVCACLREIGAPPSVYDGDDIDIDYQDEALDALERWSLLPSNEKEYAFYSRDEMEDLAKENGFNIEDDLGDAEYRRQLAEKCSAMRQKELDKKGMVSILKQVFLKAIPKGDGEDKLDYAIMGQRKEPELLREFWSLVNERHTCQAILLPGLVAPCEERSIKGMATSADGVAVMRGRDNLLRVPIEVKTRASSTTFAEQINKLEASSKGHLEAIGEGEAKLYKMNYKDPELKYFVKSHNELIQILHHTAVYRSLGCFLVIGSPRKLMAAVYVKFDKEIVESYMKIHAHLFDHTLSWAWGALDEDESVEDLVPDSIFEAIEEENLAIDRESFLYWFAIWYQIFRADDKLDLPLPKIVVKKRKKDSHKRVE